MSAAIEPKRNDGLYLQLFAVRDGIRFDMKVISLQDLTLGLTDGLVDGIQKLIQY